VLPAADEAAPESEVIHVDTGQVVLAAIGGLIVWTALVAYTVALAEVVKRAVR
jgi:hypothetical protein